MLTFSINICRCSGNIPSKSVVAWCNFFEKWKSLKSSSGHVKFRLLYPAGFFFGQKSENSWRQSGNIYEYIKFKTDSFPQMFPLDLEKAINQALTFLCQKTKNVSLKFRRWLPKFFEKKISFTQINFWTISLQFWVPCTKHLPTSEIVLFNQLRKIQKFITIFFFKRSFGHVEVSFDNREEKCLPKSGFIVRCPKLILQMDVWIFVSQKYHLNR